MYTISYNHSKGWPALLGMVGALFGVITPLATSGLFGPKIGAVIAGAGIIVAGLSDKPGAVKVPTVVATLPTEPAPVAQLGH